MKKLVIILALCVAGCNGTNNRNADNNIKDEPDTGKIILLENRKKTTKDDANGYWQKKAEEALDDMRKLKREANQLRTEQHLDITPPNETIKHENWRIECLGKVSQIEFLLKNGEIFYEGEAYKDAVNNADMSYKAMSELKDILKTPPM